MRVSLTTRGGLAAAVNAASPPVVVDTATLSQGQARELTRLVRAATAAPVVETESAARDAQSYAARDAQSYAARDAQSYAARDAQSYAARDAQSYAARDAQSYTVVVDDGGRAETIRAREPTVPDAVAELIDWVRRHGAAR
jgi:hypothetical protein